MAARKRQDDSESDESPLPSPEANDSLLGHDAAEAELLTALKSGRMHHAWLISGPKGVGKATLAFRFARFLLRYGRDPGTLAKATSLDVPATEPVARQVAAGAAQDLLIMRRGVDEKTGKEKTVIAADDARRLPIFFSLSSGAGGWRVVIVDSLEDLNDFSANALLKSLEEPPQRAILLLVAEAPGRSLATIRSRCRTLILSPMNEANLAGHLPALGAKFGLPTLKQPDQERLASLARGSVGRALDLWANDGLDAARAVESVLAQWPDLSAQRVAGLLGEARGNFATTAEMLIAALRDVARRGALGEAGGDWTAMNKAAPPAVWAEIVAELEAFFTEGQDVYLDPRAMMGEALRRIAGAGSRVVLT